jgi:hypothetical protein
MRATCKQAQHTSGIGSAARLAQDQIIHDDNGVGAQNEVIRPHAKHEQSFFSRHSFRKRLRLFPLSSDFRNISRLRHKRNARITQKLLAARRRGCEYKHEPRF